MVLAKEYTNRLKKQNESPETDPHKYSQLNCWQRSKDNTAEMIAFSSSVSGTTGHSCSKEIIIMSLEI